VESQDLLHDVAPRLGLAEAILGDDEAWVVCRPVRDDTGEVVDFVYLLANAAAEDSVGLGPLTGRAMVQLVPESREGIFGVFRDVLDTGAIHRSITPSLERADHPWPTGWTALEVRRARDLVVAHWRDATAEREHAVAAERAEARLQALLANAGEVISVYSADGRTPLFTSPSMLRVLGRDRSAGMFDHVHPQDREQVAASLGRLVAGGSGAVEEVRARLQHSDGRWLWVHGRGTNYVDDPDVGGIVINLWDVTEQHEMAERLRTQALHDPLTGLPNRRLLDAELERALARLERTSGCVGLVLCDVDYFKSVNDAFGHPAGDELLVAVTERLRGLVRPSDVVGRLGGDEFVVLCEDLRSVDELGALTRRIQSTLRGVYRVGGQDLPVTVTVGASCTPSGAVTTSDLLGEADTALYEAKRAGRDRAQVFDQRVHRRNRDRATRQGALRSAIEHDQLVLHYQPKIDLRTGRPVAAEALVRWQHPSDGLLPPYDFLPLAEESLLVVDLGEWVLRHAMRDAAHWLAHEDAPADSARPTVNINVSGRHLTHPSLLRHLDEALRLSGLDPTRVELEITETVLLQDLEMAGRILETVRERGIGIALDDFGTGYSSLTWLQRLPVDSVKLDRSFIADVLSPQGGYATDLLGGVTALAHAMGKVVIAEGVETREQHEVLVGLGCDLAQGYLYGRPSPQDPFRRATA
jgi:diguanylate cyclase (GGDEF)-like protein/PAS domain S-box-containing protein